MRKIDFGFSHWNSMSMNGYDDMTFLSVIIYIGFLLFLLLLLRKALAIEKSVSIAKQGLLSEEWIELPNGCICCSLR
jgi:hypothetical protein